MASLKAFQSELKGSLHAPFDRGYAHALRGKGTTPVDDRHPRIVVQADGADDVARTIEFARANGVELSVRSGGHDMLGASTASGGVLLDLCRMDAVNLDPSTGAARVGGGARAGALTAAGKPHGLVPILGMSPNVGIGGLTLGGGMGYLSGTHGATVDHVLAVEVVTADGRRIRADARDSPDLFWALRGGGGNFGVATAFTMRMQPVATVLAGDLSLKTDAERFIRFLRDFLAAAGDALDGEFLFALGPEAGVSMRLCWTGDPEAGDRVLRPLRSFAPVVADSVKVQPYADFASGEPNIQTMFLRGGEFEGLTDGAIEAFADVIRRGGPKDCMVGLLHYVHGQLSRAPDGETPFVRPAGHILYNIVASWNGAERHPDRVAWAEAAWEALRPASSERTYLNYLCDNGEEAVRSTFGPHYERLQAVKRRYDPNNLFRNTRNVRP